MSTTVPSGYRPHVGLNVKMFARDNGQTIVTATLSIDSDGVRTFLPVEAVAEANAIRESEYVAVSTACHRALALHPQASGVISDLLATLHDPSVRVDE